MIRFYRDVRIESIVKAAYDDVLSYEWGIFDLGEGPGFHLDISREFTEVEQEEDEANELFGDYRLSLTFRYLAIDELRAFGSGDRKCEAIEDIPVFRAFVRQSPPFSKLKDWRADRVFLDLDSP